MPQVKFKDAGEWAEQFPYQGTFTVKAGQVRECSEWVADFVCGSRDPRGEPCGSIHGGPVKAAATGPVPKAEAPATKKAGKAKKTDKD